MASGSYNSDYTQRDGRTPPFLQHELQPTNVQYVVSHYQARLTNEQLEKVRTKINELYGNSQVQRHADKINVYIVTVDQKFDINVAQILEAFQSQDGNATQIANI